MYMFSHFSQQDIENFKAEIEKRQVKEDEVKISNSTAAAGTSLLPTS